MAGHYAELLAQHNYQP